MPLHDLVAVVKDEGSVPVVAIGLQIRQLPTAMVHVGLVHNDNRQSLRARLVELSQAVVAVKVCVERAKQAARGGPKLGSRLSKGASWRMCTSLGYKDENALRCVDVGFQLARVLEVVDVEESLDPRQQ